MLGRNALGSQTLNGGSGDDCIVAGGSTSSTSNSIDGGPGTDICIGAPGTTMTFTNCEYTGTPSTGRLGDVLQLDGRQRHRTDRHPVLHGRDLDLDARLAGDAWRTAATTSGRGCRRT